MKVLRVLILLICAMMTRASAPYSAIDFPPPTNGMRLAIYGDSYVTQMKWGVYFESALWLRYPSLTNFEIVQEGKGGDTYSPATNVTGASMARLMGRVHPWAATHVAVLMTPNGSTDSNTWAGYWREYHTNITQALGATGIYLGAAPLNKSNGDTKLRDRSALHYALGGSLGYPAADLWSFLIEPYSNNYAAGHPIDLKWADATHPGSPGYLNIAYGLGRLFNVFGDGIVWSVGMNASGNASMFTPTNGNASAISFSAAGGSFTWAPTKGAMAWDDTATNALQMFPEILDYNRQMLYVSNLTAGNYYLKLNGTTLATYTNTALAAGVNLTAIRAGALYSQGTNVLAKIRLKQGFVATPDGSDLYLVASPNAGWVDWQSRTGVYYGSGDYGAALASDMATYRTNLSTGLMANVRTAAAMGSYTVAIEAVAGGGDGVASAAGTILSGTMTAGTLR